jgi:Ricin-type beta-trefoil lectin domain
MTGAGAAIGATADALRSAGTKETAMRLRRLAGLLAAAALAAGMSVGTGVAAQAATASVPSPAPGSTGAWYEIFAPLIDHSGYYRCMDVAEASVQPGQNVQTYHCHGYASNGGNQRWRFWPNADGSYQIQNVNSQLCLEAGILGGVAVWQEDCSDGSTLEDWNIITVNGTEFALQNVWERSTCLAASSSSGDSTPVIRQSCNLGYAAQIWQLG